MFRKMKNIDTAFRQVRSFTILVILACTLITGFAIYKCVSLVDRMQERIYILVNGKLLEAVAGNRTDNIAVQARDHVKTFHSLFFTLDPDDKSIQANISKALYLAGGSAKRVYDDLKETGYYSALISGNVNQTISVDSVSVNVNDYPHRFRFYGIQQIIRPTSITQRSIITEGYLRNVGKSDNNPHGFLIEKWSIKENNDLKTEARR